ncbi:D-ribose pyranase [Paenibacillus sp. NEAU-GSW1]|uniref:D-ribose pyranase n=1 Tax=Paenibacillus sp. NEAU-GSW1 TaxID=2682486 RepID=UPI0012E2E359|nr:D-ribose pyranase [Paenibacillus sp. NEAU-GSW1]MUT67305.1 D-ribose pyranase [Paenibacillus sp. NEAU-GSW1]
MKKNGILNSDIAAVIARMGHTDIIVIGDCGLPIPDSVKRIDLAVKQGLPSYLDTLEAVLADMEVETAIIASEMAEQNAPVYDRTRQLLNGIPVNAVTHEKLKELTLRAKAVIRTGEATPYANIILQSGVIFK